MSAQPTLTLYDHPVSSYAQKVRIALRHKNLKFTSTVPPGLGTLPPDPAATEFFANNPRGEVPTLLVSDAASGGKDIAIWDSTIILEYLEDRFPEPALLPKASQDPGARAKARAIEEVCDSCYEGINWGFAELTWFRRAEFDDGLKKGMLEKLSRQTRVLQRWLGEQLGESDFFGGEFGFGWADVCAVAIVNRSLYYGEEFRPEGGSRLEGWLERCKGIDAVRETIREFDENVGKMPGAAEIYLSGKRKREYRDYRLEGMIKNGGLEIVRRGIADGNVRFGWPFDE